MANNLYGSNWTDARVEQLKELWSTALSAREIAATMGGFEHMPDNGRNAVLGKAHRMNLSSKKPAVPQDREHKRPERKISKPQRVLARKAVERAPPPPFAGSLNKRFEELRLFSSVDPNQCRFIEGDTASALYCGTDTLPGQPYCAHHHAKTHAKRIKITEADRDRRKAHAAKVWFGASIKLKRTPAEVA